MITPRYNYHKSKFICWVRTKLYLGI
jgi:hypothetical protein